MGESDTDVMSVASMVFPFAIAIGCLPALPPSPARRAFFSSIFGNTDRSAGYRQGYGKSGRERFTTFPGTLPTERLMTRSLRRVRRSGPLMPYERLRLSLDELVRSDAMLCHAEAEPFAGGQKIAITTFESR